MFESIRQSARDSYQGLNDREKLLVKVAGVILPIAAFSVIGILVNNSVEAVRTEIDEKEKLLKTIGDVAPKYQQDQKKKGQDKQAQRFAPKKIENNDVKLTSFVATHATAVGVQVDSYDESDRPIGGSDSDESEGSSLYKVRVRAEIREAEFSKFLKLMERIEQTNDPVIIERITLTEKRRDPGKVRATLYVTTFKKKAKG